MTLSIQHFWIELSLYYLLSILYEDLEDQGLQWIVFTSHKTRGNRSTFGFVYDVGHCLHISHTVWCSRDFGGQRIYELSAYQSNGRDRLITNTVAQQNSQ